MKRSDFLKRLGIGLGAVVVTPRVLAEMPAKEEKLTYHLNPNNYEPKREYPLTYDECYPHDWYYVGDTFVNDSGRKYFCVYKKIMSDGVANLTLRSIKPAQDVVISNIDLRNHFHPTGGSVLMKFND